MTEADTWRELVTPKIVQAGWSTSPITIGEQRKFTNGRIYAASGKVRCRKQRRADDVLFYRRNFPLAVIEANKVIPANLLFVELGGPTDPLGRHELPLPEGCRKYSKTAPQQFEDFATAQAWWDAREEGPQALVNEVQA